jgi:hypothetical protein
LSRAKIGKRENGKTPCLTTVCLKSYGTLVLFV